MVNLFKSKFATGSFGFYLFFGLILFLIILSMSNNIGIYIRRVLIHLRPMNRHLMERFQSPRSTFFILFNLFFLLIPFMFPLFEAELYYVIVLCGFANGIFRLVFEMLVDFSYLIGLLWLSYFIDLASQRSPKIYYIRGMMFLVENYLLEYDRMVDENFEDTRLRAKTIMQQRRSSMNEDAFQKWKRAWLPLRPCEEVPRGRFPSLLVEENCVGDLPLEERGHYQYCPVLDMLVY